MNNTRRQITSMIPFVLAGCAIRTPDDLGSARVVLAPTGALRVGVNMGAPASMVVDRATNERRGVTHDVGRELASRLSVPFQLVEFRTINDVLAAMKRAEVDFTGTNATPARAKDVDFTATAMDFELGYLVPSGSPLHSASDVHKPGLRIGVNRGSTSHTTLPRLLPNAVIVAAESLATAGAMLRARSLDAFATNKPTLFELSDSVPGSRVLDGNWGAEHWALAIPKGREPGLTYLNQFLKEIRTDGTLQRAIARSGLRGAVLS